MEPEELPPMWALDMAARLAHSQNYALAVQCNGGRMADSLIAHARTLAKYEKPPVDEAEMKRRQDAREAVIYRQRSYGWKDADVNNGWPMMPAGLPLTEAAYIALCHRDGVTPTPVSEWSDK